MDIAIRAATVGDFAAVTALLEELGRPKVLGTPDEPRHRERFQGWLEHPNLYLFVATDEHDGGRVVGVVDMNLAPRLNFGSRQAWIPDLVVTDAARSNGAGAALLDRCEQVARERKAWGMKLESANWRKRAHDFYLREGWTNDAKSFDRILATDVVWPPRPPGQG